MKIDITLRHLEHTDSIDEKIKKKSQRLEKWLGNDESAHLHWTSWVENRNHVSEAQVHYMGQDYFAKASSDDLYKTLDMVVGKLDTQLHKAHDMTKKPYERGRNNV